MERPGTTKTAMGSTGRPDHAGKVRCRPGHTPQGPARGRANQSRLPRVEKTDIVSTLELRPSGPFNLRRRRSVGRSPTDSPF